MEKRILFLLILLFGLTELGIAQVTRGGSEKNYDRFRIKYDTIVSERKVLQDASINNPFSNYNSIQIGFARGYGYSTGLPSAFEYTNSPYYGEPIASGEIGLGNGFSFQFENQQAFNGINKNLIRMLDFHGRFGMGYTNLSQDWSSIYSRNTPDPASSEAFFNDLLEAGNYNNFHIINFGYGIGLTVYPVKETKNLAVDITYGLNLNLIFGGTANLNLEENFQDGSSQEVTVDITDYDGGSIGFSNYLRLGIRYSNFMFFVQPNFGVNMIDLTSSEDSIEENIEIEYFDPFNGFSDFQSGFTSYERSGRTRLNNFQIGVGVTF